MKKKVLGLAFIAISMVAFNSMAQASCDNTPNRECATNAKCQKSDKKGHRAQCNPFEGMQLTEAQQVQLQQLASKQKAARKQHAQACKENKQRDNEARMAERRASRKSYLEEVKAIIGPDQYVVFLENMYVNGGGHNHGKAAFGKAKHDKMHGDRHKQSDRKNGRDNQKHHASLRNAKATNDTAKSNS